MRFCSSKKGIPDLLRTAATDAPKTKIRLLVELQCNRKLNFQAS
jgi:hypothetical protein